MKGEPFQKLDCIALQFIGLCLHFIGPYLHLIGLGLHFIGPYLHFIGPCLHFIGLCFWVIGFCLHFIEPLPFISSGYVLTSHGSMTFLHFMGQCSSLY